MGIQSPRLLVFFVSPAFLLYHEAEKSAISSKKLTHKYSSPLPQRAWLFVFLVRQRQAKLGAQEAYAYLFDRPDTW